MINDFLIFTDAASDLPTELIETHGISVLPMYFEIDGKSYRHYPDGRELGYSRFYQILRSGIMAKTSLVNSLEYLHYFEPVLKRGLDILYISLSSGLSGTYQSSAIAAKELMERYPERKIYCVSPEKQTIFIGHGDCIDDAGILASMVEQRFALKNIAVSYIGPIIGAHTGPDVMTLCFFGSEK